MGSGGGLFIEDAGNPQRVRASPSGGNCDRVLGPLPSRSTAWGLGACMRLGDQGTKGYTWGIQVSYLDESGQTKPSQAPGPWCLWI